MDFNKMLTDKYKPLKLVTAYREYKISEISFPKLKNLIYGLNKVKKGKLNWIILSHKPPQDNSEGVLHYESRGKEYQLYYEYKEESFVNEANNEIEEVEDPFL